MSIHPQALGMHRGDVTCVKLTFFFLPEHMRLGNLHAVKTPVIKYPYIPLSEQIRSILKIPGIEASLDGWRNKLRFPGEYGDIFDGNMCRLKLKAPDGLLFFSNHKRHGLNDELRIGVNLGVDWCVLCVDSSNLTDDFALGSLTFRVI